MEQRIKQETSAWYNAAGDTATGSLLKPNFTPNNVRESQTCIHN